MVAVTGLVDRRGRWTAGPGSRSGRSMAPAKGGRRDRGRDRGRGDRVAAEDDGAEWRVTTRRRRSGRRFAAGRGEARLRGRRDESAQAVGGREAIGETVLFRGAQPGLALEPSGWGPRPHLTETAGRETLR